MKYVIETTNDGCIETIELHDGTKFVKRHTKTGYGAKSEDEEFADQMEKNGICDEMVNKVYDTFDGFIASDFMDIAELDC